MKTTIALAVFVGCTAAAASAQSPSSAFNRGNGLAGMAEPRPGRGAREVHGSARTCAASRASHVRTATRKSRPSRPAPAPSTAIPGVIAAGQSWKVVWHWQGNNADGPIAGDDGKLLFANNDASNVMEMDPATGLARIAYDDVNTGGAVSRSKNGALFVLSRGLGSGIIQLEPQRKMFANTFRGEPLDCVGGTPNDLTRRRARRRLHLRVGRRACSTRTRKASSRSMATAITGANGIILSPDERTLYVTNGPLVVAFDVQADGSLTNQREFGKLRGGTGGDGSAVDSEGRLYVSTGRSIDVFSAARRVLGLDSGAARHARHGVRRPRQEDALRHRLLRRLGHAERAQPRHRDPDDRAGLHGPREVARRGISLIAQRDHRVHAHRSPRRDNAGDERDGARIAVTAT